MNIITNEIFKEMKTVFIPIQLILLFFVLSLSSCTDDPVDVNNSNDSDYELVNNWIYTNMISDYFWYNTITDHKVPETMYPEDYFYSLIYEQEDKWSYITDDFIGLVNDLMGTPVSMGYSPTFGKITGTNDVFMIIEYVYNDSPAKRAGLKRGDLILEINGTQLNVDNFVDLFYENNQTLRFGHISNGSIYPDNKTMSMTAEQLDINPALFDTIYVKNEIRVGYIVITEFVDNQKFIQDVGSSLTKLKNQGASQLIVDLRYNGGGFITSAQWLASAIAPASVVNNESLLTKLNFNDKLEPTKKPEDKQYNMIQNNINFNLTQVVFLTAHGTASASELVMIGLYPYMNVIQVGENTYGKYTGSVVIADYHMPPLHNWAMMPIVMKYANADGFTDFKNGLTPDYNIKDDLLAAYAFGDINDPIIEKALEICTGLDLVKSADCNNSTDLLYNKIFTKQQMNKKNLIVPFK